MFGLVKRKMIGVRVELGQRRKGFISAERLTMVMDGKDPQTAFGIYKDIGYAYWILSMICMVYEEIGSTIEMYLVV